MAKYIDAEKVIAALTDTLQYEGMVMDELISVVANIPAADVVERKNGKWIDDGMHGDFAWEIDGRGSCWHEWICSECGDWNKSATHFCPNCGADMRGET